MPRKKEPKTSAGPMEKPALVEAMPDIQPREPWPPSLNLRSSFDGARPVLMSIRQVLLDQVYHLPPWQRGQEWTPAQQVALCEAVWTGLPVAPMLLWERRRADGSKYAVVLDGQQRLCAMGATVLRHDGTPCEPTSAHLDLETGRWLAGPAEDWPPITMARAVDFRWSLATGRSLDYTPDKRWHFLSLIAMAADRLQESTFMYCMGPSTTADDAVRVFRSWNVPGVPIPPDKVEALIRAADTDWEPNPVA